MNLMQLLSITALIVSCIAAGPIAAQNSTATAQESAPETAATAQETTPETAATAQESTSESTATAQESAMETAAEAQVIVPETAAQFSDRVIVSLSGWNVSASRVALEEKREAFGETVAYKTALGLLQAESGELDIAAQTLATASLADATDPAPEFFRGLALYWKKDPVGSKDGWQKANTRAQTIVANNPMDARAHFYSGASAVYLKQFVAARTSLAAALANGFDEVMVNYYIGLSYAFEQNWQKAKESLDLVIGKDERFAYAYFYRGLVWEKLGRKDNMLLDMDQFVKLAPAAPDAGKAKALLAAAGR